MLWRNGDKLIFIYGSLNWFSLPLDARLGVEIYLWDCLYRDPSNWESQQELDDIWNQFQCDYIEYLIESAIDEHLILEERKRKIWQMKRSFVKKYPDGLVGSPPVLDRPLADIIKENTVESDDEKV
jgi:hypothetical protein